MLVSAGWVKKKIQKHISYVKYRVLFKEVSRTGQEMDMGFLHVYVMSNSSECNWHEKYLTGEKWFTNGLCSNWRLFSAKKSMNVWLNTTRLKILASQTEHLQMSRTGNLCFYPWINLKCLCFWYKKTIPLTTFTFYINMSWTELINFSLNVIFNSPTGASIYTYNV